MQSGPGGSPGLEVNLGAPLAPGEGLQRRGGKTSAPGAGAPWPAGRAAQQQDALPPPAEDAAGGDAHTRVAGVRAVGPADVATSVRSTKKQKKTKPKKATPETFELASVDCEIKMTAANAVTSSFLNNLV